jgi:serine/threonine protein kinase/tetratricopeptide (TPR) repeat protein
LNSELTEDENFLTRFEKEAQSIAALEHPNILSVYDYGQAEDTAYLVTPYIEGGTLHDKLRKERKFTLPQASAYLTQVAAALDYAHRRFIVHRDIKPQNMLLRAEDDRLLLGDFGIAKVLSSSSAQSRTGVMGTISYMSPEQLEGNVAVGTDIYALGCVLFQMLTGELPYTGATEQVMMGHLLRPIPSIIERSQGQVPPPVQDVINRALAKKPEDRFQSAGEMAKAFAAIASGGSVSFTSPTAAINPADLLNRNSTAGYGATQAPTNFQGQPQGPSGNFAAPATNYDRTQVAGFSGQYTQQGATATGTPPQGNFPPGTTPPPGFGGTPPYGTVPPGGTPPQGYNNTPSGGFTSPQVVAAGTKRPNLALIGGITAIVLVTIAAILVIILVTSGPGPTPDPARQTATAEAKATSDAGLLATPTLGPTTAPVTTAPVTTAPVTTAPPTTAPVDPVSTALKDAYATFFTQGDLQGGLGKYRKLSIDNPANAKVWRDYGLALYLYDQDAGGSEPLEKSLQYDAKDPLAYLYLADVYGDSARYSDAEKAAQQALQLDPNGWVGHLAMATYYTYVLKLDQAKPELTAAQQAAGSSATDPYYNWLLATDLSYQEDYSGSSAAMDKTIAAWPNLPSALFVRGDIYLYAPGDDATFKANQAKALDLYQKAQKIAPDSANTNAHLANYYMESGDYTNAETYANNALKKAATNKQALYVLGVVQDNGKKYDDAIGNFDRCIQQDPYYANCYFWWSYTLLDRAYDTDKSNPTQAKADRTLALEKAQKALELYPTSANYNWIVGYVYYEQGDYTNSIPHMQKATAIAPNNANYYGWLGLAYYYNDQKDQAQVQYNKGIAIEPDNVLLKTLKGLLDK